MTLFGSLTAGTWGVVLLQETPPGSEEQGVQGTEEGAGKERSWLDTDSLLQGTSASRKWAVLFNQTGLIWQAWSRLQRRQSERQKDPTRQLSVDREAILHCQRLCPEPCLRESRIREPSFDCHAPAWRAILAGEFNCVAGDLDVKPIALGRRRSDDLGGH